MRYIFIIILLTNLTLVGYLLAQKDSENTCENDEEMVLIPAGEFQMGNDKGFGNERPEHTVYLDDFYIDKYPVTNAQYKKFVEATGHREPKGSGPVNGDWQNEFKPWEDPNFNGDDQPVVCVSWDDAKAYAEWAGKRLPTEAEWEKSARGGLVGKKYVWGDEFPPPNKVGNLADVSLSKVFKDWDIIKNYDDGYVYTAPVKSFEPNGYGLFGVSGNIWEWCADWYGKDYYANSPKENPKGPESGTNRVVRGISWCMSKREYLNVSFRFSIRPNRTLNYVGFRCAKSK